MVTVTTSGGASMSLFLSGRTLRVVTPSLFFVGKEEVKTISERPYSTATFFNLNLQESPPSKQSERRRGMEERSADVKKLQYEEMAG